MTATSVQKPADPAFRRPRAAWFNAAKSHIRGQFVRPRVRWTMGLWAIVSVYMAAQHPRAEGLEGLAWQGAKASNLRTRELNSLRSQYLF